MPAKTMESRSERDSRLENRFPADESAVAPNGGPSSGNGSESHAEQAGSQPLDVDEIMAGIRRAIKIGADKIGAESGGEQPLRYTPPAERLFDGAPSSILYSEELNYLNARWNSWSERENYSSHRRLLGPLVVRLKRRIRDFLWESIFSSYFEREREFQMQLVKFLNSTARYVDARDADLFWQLVKKIDNDVAAVNERMDVLHDSTRLRIDRLLQQVEDELSAPRGKRQL